MKNVNEAIVSAQRAMLQSQRADGAWDGLCELGPSCTSQVLIALSFLERLAPGDAVEGAKWLRSQQRQDGSFAGYPFAREGDLGSTGCAWAALLLSPEAADQQAASAAWAFVEKNGGMDALLKLVLTGDVSAVYLALAGRLDAERLPQPPLFWVLVPGAVNMAMKKLTYQVVLGAVSMALITRHLRGKWDSLSKLAIGRAADLLATFQNENGGFNSVTIATAIFAAGLHATGRFKDDERAQRAATWLLSRAIRNDAGLHFDVFPSDIWTTAYNLRVLIESGVSRADASVQNAVDYLLRTQSQVLQPSYNNAKPHAVRTGGWAFEDGNPTMPDCDDTAVVLSALGRAASVDASPALPAELLARTRRAIDTGRKWLLDMQNPDGGWASFAWGLPGKEPGPAMTEPFELPIHNPLALIDMVLHPPVIFGDPSTEDLTARVIDALSVTGGGASALAKGIDFLRDQQCDTGAWWGRWVVNYLAGTAYVLSALSRTKEDLSAAYVQKAIRWVLAHQNADGGFGETVATYEHPERAGRGASTAPLTGLVLIALVDVGLAESAEAKRAVAYLLAAQRPDGTWPNGDYVAPALPPTVFYSYAPAAQYLPLQALAYIAHPEIEEVPLPDASRWTDAVLAPMRHVTDALADRLVGEVYRENEVGSVNEFLMALFRNDNPVPQDLPPAIRDYFDRTAPLPPWADTAKLAIAQELFEDSGVQITMGLFFSSLPQAYAAASGALVLVQTQAMQRNTKQRVFETAQFIFDVLDKGAFEANGKGIRAAQRVRLMHAAIRGLILRRQDVRWDSDMHGLPINQEDLAGTLMTFSAVTFDAVRRYGVAVTDAQGEAWMHAWNVIGHYLGIEPALLPKSMADARQLMEAIRRRQWAPSSEGRDLAAALLDMMQKFFTFDIPVFRGMVPTQIRFLAGDQCADLLGIAQTHLEGFLEIGADVVRDADDPNHESLVGEAMGTIADQAMKLIVLAEREGKQASFRLPESLRRTVIPNT